MDMTDVALTSGGVFSGQVVDVQGRPQAGSTVAVSQTQQVVATATTDANGQFSIRGLQGGMYQVVAGQGMKLLSLAGTRHGSARCSAIGAPGQQAARLYADREDCVTG